MVMPKFNKQEFHTFLLQNQVVGLVPDGITLKSGRISYWYANCRNLTDQVGKAQTLVRYLLDFVQDENLDFDFFYGVPEGITKLSILANYIHGQNCNNPGQPLVMGRSQPKPHGDPKDRFFIGPVRQGHRVIVIEDVTTTGESLLKALEIINSAGLKIVKGLVKKTSFISIGHCALQPHAKTGRRQPRGTEGGVPGVSLSRTVQRVGFPALLFHRDSSGTGYTAESG